MRHECYQSICLVSRQQLRAARLLLNLSRRELSERSGVSESSIKWIEKGGINARMSTVHRLHDALVAMGVEFLPEGLVRVPGMMSQSPRDMKFE